MENRFSTTVSKIWKFVKQWFEFAVLFTVFLLILHWAVKGTFSSSYMIRLEAYIRIALIILCVIAFAILRMYNSVVNNTRFLIKLREVIRKLSQDFPILTRSLNKTTGAMDRNNTYLKTLNKSVESLKGEVEDLDLTIERLNSIGKKDEK